MPARQFRQRLDRVEAVQWTGDNEDEVIALAGPGNFNALDEDDRANCDNPDWTAQLHEGEHSTWAGVYTGTWIVRDSKGRLSAYSPEAFSDMYEPVPGAGAGVTVNVIQKHPEPSQVVFVPDPRMRA
jgi:hypothetical protein